MTRHFASLKNMLLIASVALLPMAAVNATAQNSARVTVPFSFVANHHVVPAGYYEVISSDTTLTLINAADGRAEAMLLVRQEEGNPIESQSWLRFQVSGSRHILTEIQFAGSSMHSKMLSQPKQERQVASDERTETIQLAMR